MTTPQPFSLRIFVAEGDPDGLRLVERANWIGRAVIDQLDVVDAKRRV